MSFVQGDETEWLVADGKGLFAMGTARGVRTRKYHSFMSSIAGRLETNFIADFDLNCHGKPLSTHLYASSNGPVRYPKGEVKLEAFEATPWPRWNWRLEEGSLQVALQSLVSGGFALHFEWDGATSAPLRILPLFAFRPLHGLGGAAVEARALRDSVQFRSQAAASNAVHDVFIGSRTPFEWRAENAWYRNFHYPIEQERGYDSTEDLFSAGSFEFKLKPGQTMQLSFALAPLVSTAEQRDRRDEPRAAAAPVSRLEDFMLENPPGIVAGYPWFGEWGRDTFISLPGIWAGVALADASKLDRVSSWTLELAEHWAKFIERDGMMPNVITTNGPQWDSADATLWFTHALASLWSMALARGATDFAQMLKARLRRALAAAIESIRAGTHRYLSIRADGLLVTSGNHTTWMDARLNGAAATPRNGVLPEINALWVQAHGLRLLWEERRGDRVLELARRAIALDVEMERPNIVFMYSLPLGPSVLAGEIDLTQFLKRDAEALSEHFLTPVGLRTLKPDAQGYRDCYSGDQPSRDRCYHQGPAWGWLLGHYEMAARRFHAWGWPAPLPPAVSSSVSSSLKLSTIDGHFAELFDAEAPWSPRGAPAQAWSLACRAEARAQVAWKMDERLERILRETIL